MDESSTAAAIIHAMGTENWDSRLDNIFKYTTKKGEDIEECKKKLG